MTDVLQQIAEQELNRGLPWLQDFRANGQQKLSHYKWPDRRTEDWKYTNLAALTKQDYFKASGALVGGVESRLKQLSLADSKCHHLVFINGLFSNEHSDVGSLPEGVNLVCFDQANTSQREKIQSLLGTISAPEKHLFSAVNSSLLENGVFLNVKRGVVLKDPIQITCLSTASDKAFHVPQRVLALFEERSEATLIEQFASSDDSSSCITHGVTELIVEAGARCQHYRLHQEGQESMHIGGVHASLQRDASLNSFHAAFGSRLQRVDLVVHHMGEGAECVLNGIYLPQQGQHVDYHTCIEHRVPHCTSAENFRGVIGGNGRAVFNGRIHIHPQAQKTLAQLSNKNLLTSNKAEVDTKPELEIYADDVQCAHGTTVAQLDEKAMQYCLTRGIARKQAEVMLSFGFINALVDEIKSEAVAAYLGPIISDLFSREPSLKGTVL